MSNKTPYEIRLELLQLANGILCDKNFKDCERLREDWQAKKEVTMMQAHQQHHYPTLDSYPDMPSVNQEEIIELAKKLNEFVSNG